MRNAEFKKFYEALNENINNEVILHAGYLWLNLTNAQVTKIRNLAISKGFKPDEKNCIHIGIYVLHDMEKGWQA